MEMDGNDIAAIGKRFVYVIINLHLRNSTYVINHAAQSSAMYVLMIPGCVDGY